MFEQTTLKPFNSLFWQIAEDYMLSFLKGCDDFLFIQLHIPA